jgi:hypothetical protein
LRRSVAEAAGTRRQSALLLIDGPHHLLGITRAGGSIARHDFVEMREID